jgi:signal transduction histidine kinase
MLKIRTKIIFSYIIVSLVIVATISIAVNVMFESVFRSYVMRQKEQRIDEIVERIEEHYNSFGGGWNPGVLDSIGMGAMSDSLIVRVKNLDGTHIWDAWTHHNGACRALMLNLYENMSNRYPNFNGEYTEQSYELTVNDQPIGIVDIGYFGPFFYTDEDIYFIDSLNRMLIYITGVSLAVAILLGLSISIWLSAPIMQVTRAASQIQRGKFSERVKLKSKTKEISELIQAINGLAETLQTVESLRKRLTADVAHELRTPLATLRGQMEAMIEGIWEPDMQRLQSSHDEIMRLTRMVDDLKKLSEFESENLMLNKKTFDLSGLIQQIAMNFEGSFAGKGVHLELEQSYIGYIVADRDRITQVIFNIVSNALKYTEAGGTVRITTDAAKDSVVIKIEDTGIGIAKKDLPFIFERFYRTDKSRNSFTGGSGIGLTIAKALVLAHEGDIMVTSEPQQGTTFTVYLPVHDQKFM